MHMQRVMRIPTLCAAVIYSSSVTFAFQPPAFTVSPLRQAAFPLFQMRNKFPLRRLHTSVLSLAASDDSKETAPPLDKRFEAWVDRSAKVSQEFENAKLLGDNFLVKESAVLYDKSGSVVDPSSIDEDASVGILFSCGWCPACVSFAPLLKAYYEAQNEPAEGRAKVQLIFVSSDPSEADAKAVFSQAQGDWLMLDYNSPLRSEWKRRYGVWAGRESSEFATDISSFKARRSGVPAVAIVGRAGELVNFLDAEARGIESLLDWAPEDYVWNE